jgi:hypothetical protein
LEAIHPAIRAFDLEVYRSAERSHRWSPAGFGHFSPDEERQQDQQQDGGAAAQLE